MFLIVSSTFTSSLIYDYDCFSVWTDCQLKNLFVYLEDFSPAFFIKHSLLEMHLVEEFGLLNLFLSDNLACREHKKL